MSEYKYTFNLHPEMHEPKGSVDWSKYYSYNTRITSNNVNIDGDTRIIIEKFDYDGNLIRETYYYYKNILIESDIAIYNGKENITDKYIMSSQYLNEHHGYENFL